MKRFASVLLTVVFLFLPLGAFSESATEALQEMYAQGELLMAQEKYSEAAAQFDQLGTYRDSSQMAMYCKALMSAEDFGMYDIAVSAFQGLEDFKDSRQMAVYYAARGKQEAGEKIFSGLKSETDGTLKAGCQSFTDAMELYASLALFRDSMNRYSDCNTKSRAISAELDERRERRLEETYQQALALEQQGQYAEAISRYESLEGYKDALERIRVCEDAVSDGIYQQALALEQEGDYTGAISMYGDIPLYKDSTERITACNEAILEEKYQAALALEQEGKYEEAIAAYREIPEHKDSANRISACEESIKEGIYRQALALEKQRDYEQAIAVYETVAEYADVKERIKHCKTGLVFLKGLAYEAEGKYQEAANVYLRTPGFEDADDHLEACRMAIYRNAQDLRAGGEYAAAVSLYRTVEPFLAEEVRSAWTEDVYQSALGLEQNRQFEDAVYLLRYLGDYSAAPSHLVSCLYEQGGQFEETGEYQAAYRNFLETGDYRDSRDRAAACREEIVALVKQYRGRIGSGNSHAAGLCSDGTVLLAGEHSGARGETLNGWSDIAMIGCSGMDTVGVRKNGTVVAAGHGGFKVSKWQGITEVAVNDSFVLGVKKNGTVVIAFSGNHKRLSDKDKALQKEVGKWKNIVSVSTGFWNVMALKKDGTVIAKDLVPFGDYPVGGWRDITEIAAGAEVIAGLRSDGTVVALGTQSGLSDKDVETTVAGWTDIVSISAYSGTVYGLQADGTLLSTAQKEPLGTGFISIGGRFAVRTDGTVAKFTWKIEGTDNWDLIR